jgi:putative ABC transport system permease protein
MTWWKSLFRKPDDAQLDSEMRFHIEGLIEEKIAAGLRPEEARRQALLEFGGTEQWKEEVRDVHRVAVIESTLSNLRYAFRGVRKSPSFAGAIIVTLALGIGANSAIFSALDTILIRPLPFPNGDQLMSLIQYNPKAKNPETHIAPVRIEDWNRMNSTFQAITGYYTEDISESSGTLPEKITRAWVAPRFFQVWGIAPALGREFLPEDSPFSGPDSVIISDRFWRRRFGADPSTIGKKLRIEPYSYSIVGIMPASFLFPERDVDLWSPVPLQGPYTQMRDSTWYTGIGRLKPRVTAAQARADLATVQAQLGNEYPKTDAELAAGIQPLKESTVGGVRRSLWILFGSVSVLLLIACTNIAALLLARTAERRREISIRYSLGASRAAIVMQLLTEVFVLALAGSALALGVAGAASQVFQSLAKNLPRVQEIGLNGRLVLYTAACAVLTTLLCGLFPAVRGTRRTLAGSLAQAGRTQVSGRNPLQWLLVSVQVALAVTLLVGAGLLLRTFQALGRVSPGFDRDHVLTFRISANWGETTDQKRLRQRMDRDLDALRSIPGVEGAATSLTLPGVPLGNPGELKVMEGQADPNHKIVATSRYVSAGYFATMHIPLLAGEACRKTLAGTAVVNRKFADTYLAGRTAIGSHLQVLPANRRGRSRGRSGARAIADGLLVPQCTGTQSGLSHSNPWQPAGAGRGRPEKDSRHRTEPFRVRSGAARGTPQRCARRESSSHHAVVVLRADRGCTGLHGPVWNTQLHCQHPAARSRIAAGGGRVTRTSGDSVSLRRHAGIRVGLPGRLRSGRRILARAGEHAVRRHFIGRSHVCRCRRAGARDRHAGLLAAGRPGRARGADAGVAGRVASRQRRQYLLAELHRALDVGMSGRSAVAGLAIGNLQRTWVSGITQRPPRTGDWILRVHVVVQI